MILKLPLVAILDASGARVMQWNNVTSQKGLFSLKMPLAEEPVLGSWKIKAEVKGVMVEQIFKVEEYGKSFQCYVWERSYSWIEGWTLVLNHD